MSADSLGDRMKLKYEDVTRTKLTGRIPKIIRVDGRAFHTLTKNCEKPFDPFLIDCMNHTATVLMTEIQGSCICYIQSDEVSILVNDYKKLESQTWFDGNIQKMVSISASVASVAFTNKWRERYDTDAHFDARVFCVPERDVNNYFHWRQQDWCRNSIQMLCRSVYSHKEMSNKNTQDMHEMLHTKGMNWNNIPTYQKRGRCIVKTVNGWIVDNEIPTFSKDPYYIEQHLVPDETRREE